jgi:hypothetical protein
VAERKLQQAERQGVRLEFLARRRRGLQLAGEIDEERAALRAFDGAPGGA